MGASQSIFFFNHQTKYYRLAGYRPARLDHLIIDRQLIQCSVE